MYSSFGLLSTALTSQSYISQANFLTLCKSNQEFHNIINLSRQHYLRNTHLHVGLQETCPTEWTQSTQGVITPGERQ